jgi:hypothetical protein
VRTLGLLLFPFLFLDLYVIFSFLMAVMSRQHLSATRLAQAFTFSLVPIAIAYHMAHYFSFLLVHGQRLIPLLSDPLGNGWDLFGTATYRIDIGIVGARFAWYTAVIAIVLGHVIAVYLAHLIAMRLWRNRTVAIRSQYPMLVLMVGYTIISLWILAQPVVEEGAHEAGAANADSPGAVTVLPTMLPAALTPAAPLTGPPATEALHHNPAGLLAAAQAQAFLQTLPGLPREAPEARKRLARTAGSHDDRSATPKATAYTNRSLP